MTPRRRIGSEESKTRAVILDATAELLVEEGYSAVSSRRVAARVGVNPALVHYYFGTMEDLLLAVFRRGADAYLERLRQALEAELPLRTLWELGTEPHGMTEFLALANRHKAIRDEIAAYAGRVRKLQTDALTSVFRAHGVDEGRFPPGAVMMLIESISRLLLIDSSLGITAGHDELTSFVEQFLGRLEPRADSDGSPAR